jgi:hypothetical protein
LRRWAKERRSKTSRAQVTPNAPRLCAASGPLARLHCERKGGYVCRPVPWRYMDSVASRRWSSYPLCRLRVRVVRFCARWRLGLTGSPAFARLADASAAEPASCAGSLMSRSPVDRIASARADLRPFVQPVRSCSTKCTRTFRPSTTHRRCAARMPIRMTAHFLFMRPRPKGSSRAPAESVCCAGDGDRSQISFRALTKHIHACDKCGHVATRDNTLSVNGPSAHSCHTPRAAHADDPRREAQEEDLGPVCRQSAAPSIQEDLPCAHVRRGGLQRFRSAPSGQAGPYHFRP